MNRFETDMKPIFNLANQNYEKELKAEIRRVNQVLRETHNPHEFRQNKAHLKRLERELRQTNGKQQKKN